MRNFNDHKRNKTKLFVVGELVTALQTLGREDVVDTVLSGCSLYRIVEQSR